MHQHVVCGRCLVCIDSTLMRAWTSSHHTHVVPAFQFQTRFEQIIQCLWRRFVGFTFFFAAVTIPNKSNAWHSEGDASQRWGATAETEIVWPSCSSLERWWRRGRWICRPGRSAGEEGLVRRSTEGNDMHVTHLAQASLVITSQMPSQARMSVNVSGRLSWVISGTQDTWASECMVAHHASAAIPKPLYSINRERRNAVHNVARQTICFSGGNRVTSSLSEQLFL